MRRSARSMPTGEGSRGGHWHEAWYRSAYYRAWRAAHPEYRERERTRMIRRKLLLRIAAICAALALFTGTASAQPAVVVHRLGGNPCGVSVSGVGYSHGLVTVQIIATLPGKAVPQVVSSAAQYVNAAGRWHVSFHPPLSTGFAIRASGGTSLFVTYVDSTCTP